MRFLVLTMISLQTLVRVPGEPISFSRDLAPVIQDKCLSCHNSDKAKGGYRMNTFSAVLTPGSSGQNPVKAEMPEASELLKRLNSIDEDERMPQKSSPLDPSQIELFKLWIGQGAQLDQPGKEAVSINELMPARLHRSAPDRYARPLPILALAYVPNTNILAVSGYHELTFWSPTGQLLRRLPNFPRRTRSIAFHPSGNLLAIAGGQPGREGEISTFSVSTGKVITNLVRTSDEMLTVCSSPDGKYLAGAGTDNSIHVFNFETGARITTIQQHADWVTSVAFAADGKRLASASRDRTARVYDALTGILDATYNSHAVPLLAVGFGSDETVFSGGRDRVVHQWKIEDSKKRGELEGFTGDVHQLLSAGESIFSVSADGQVRQHNAASRKLVRAFTGHTHPVFALAVSPGGTLASGGHDGEVRIWNSVDGQLLHRFIASPGFQSVTH